jgi:hypothetical protein
VSVTGGGVAPPVGVDAPPPQCERAKAVAPHNMIRRVPGGRFRPALLVFFMDLLVRLRPRRATRPTADAGGLTEAVGTEMLGVTPRIRQVIDY